MPAKEHDHAYNIGTLNKFFAISSVLLVGSLFWMFHQDHERPWKKYQREFQELEKERAASQLGQIVKNSQTGDARKEMERLENDIKAASEALEAKKTELLAIREKIDTLTTKIYQRNNLDLQFRKVEYDVIKFQIEEAIQRGKTPALRLVRKHAKMIQGSKEYPENRERREKLLSELSGLADDWDNKWQKGVDALFRAWTRVVAVGQENVKRLEAEQAVLRKQEKDIRAAAVQAKKGLQSRRTSQEVLTRKLASLGVTVHRDKYGSIKTGKGFPTFLHTFRNAPVINFIGPTVKVEQKVVDKIRDDYFFAQPSKVDRCITCHLGIDQKGFEDAKQPFATHPGVHENLYLTSASPHPIETFGCSVCHSGMAWSTDFLRVFHMPNDDSQREKWDHWTKEQLGKSWTDNFKKEGHYWDYPMLPTKYTESNCLQCHQDPTSIPVAKKLNQGYQLFKESGCFGCHKTKTFENEPKVGPNLQHVSYKIDPEWMMKWVKNPQRSLSHRTMPRIFDLSNSSGIDYAGHNLTVQNNAEIYAIVTYLQELSEKSDTYKPIDILGEGSAENGKELLISKGCLACHENKAAKEFLIESLVSSEDEELGPDEIFEEIQKTIPGGIRDANFGPNLSGVASKLSKDKAKARLWLVDWLKRPQHYYPQSTMPNFRLSDQEASDISAFLLTQRDEEMDKAETPKLEESVLNQLLTDRFAERMVRTRAQKEVEGLTVKERLLALGEIGVNHYGCTGCHLISGMEKAQGIGPELSSFGSKLLKKLDFGLLHHHFENQRHSKIAWVEQKLKAPRSFDMEPKASSNGHGGDSHSGDIEFQGLRRKARKDRLRMPQFDFTQEQIEALVTFVTGMTGRDVHPDYIDKLQGQRGDIVRGEHVLRKYNCEGCHQLSLDKITHAFGDGKEATFHGRFIQRFYNEDDEFSLYIFQAWSETENQNGRVGIGSMVSTMKEKVKKYEPGRGGTVIPYIVGERAAELNVPRVEAINYAPPPLHEEGRKVQYKWLYQFLMQPSTIRPATKIVMPTFPLSDNETNAIVAYFAARAQGQLNEKASGILSLLKDAKWLENAPGDVKRRLSKAEEGRLGPEDIKALAGAVLAQSGAETNLDFKSSQLLKEYVDFDYPFERIREKEASYIASKNKEYLQKADQLMAKETRGADDKVMKGMDCLACHYAGERKPTGKPTDHAPNLARVQDRLRPSIVQRWLLNPSQILPGTRMTDFFKDELSTADYLKNEFTYQNIFPGTAQEQAGAIKDLLYNWKQ